jgi:hypothetical protein
MFSISSGAFLDLVGAYSLSEAQDTIGRSPERMKA